MNEIEIIERLANGSTFVAVPVEEIDATALDYVPRVLTGEASKGNVAIVNAKYLRDLIKAKEEYDWLLQEPINRRYMQEVTRAQGSRKALEDELKRYAARLMNDTCPSCRRALVEKYGTEEEQNERLWRRVKSLRDLDRPNSMFDRVGRRSRVGVAALGEGKDSPR